jgi:ferrous iron transport protein A
MPRPLSDAALFAPHRLVEVGGPRAFRRRLLELGFVPGTAVRVVGVAPLGDPLELELRGCRISIRRADAQSVRVLPA